VQKSTGTLNIFCVTIACFILVQSVKCRVNKKSQNPKKAQSKQAKAALTFHFRQSLLSPARAGCCPGLQTVSVRPSALLGQSNLPIIRPFGPQSRQKHSATRLSRVSPAGRQLPHPFAPLFARTAHDRRRCDRVRVCSPQVRGGTFLNKSG